MDKLDSIRARLEAATPGPWAEANEEIYSVTTEHALNWHIGNRNFIAHAPEDILYLLDEVERLRRERDEMNAYLKCADEAFKPLR